MTDYIDREKAIKALKKMRLDDRKNYPISEDAEEKEFNCGVQQGESWAITCINNLPSADVKPVTRSEWVYLGREEVFDISGVRTWGARYQCRSCGFEPIFIEDHGRYDFCPNCGADMGGN